MFYQNNLKKQLILFYLVRILFFSFIHEQSLDYYYYYYYLVIDIEPQRLKVDMKLLADHLAERHLPMEQRELQTIAQNVIQNLIDTERRSL